MYVSLSIYIYIYTYTHVYVCINVLFNLEGGDVNAVRDAIEASRDVSLISQLLADAEDQLVQEHIYIYIYIYIFFFTHT